MAIDQMEDTPISIAEKTQPTKATEFKANPPSRPVDPTRLEQSIRKAHDSGAWGKKSEDPEKIKQEYTQKLKKTEGMTPTPTSEVDKQHLVNLTAKVEGVSPRQVEKNLENRAGVEKKGFFSRLVGKFRAHKVDKNMGGLGALEERRLRPEFQKLSDYPGTGNKKYQEMMAKKSEQERVRKADDLKKQTYNVSSPEPEKRVGMEKEAIRQLQEEKINQNS